MNRKSELRIALVDTLYFIAGSILYGIGVYVFALNANFATGGVTGIALVLNHVTGFPLGTTIFLLNIPLALIGLRVIGARFILKSVWAVAISSLFLDVIFPRLPAYSGNPLLAAMFTGVFMGAGLALIYMRGASTGGSDFIVMSLRKKRPHMSVGQLNLIMDGVIIAAGGLVYGQVDALLYGIISSFAASQVLDGILYGAGSSKLAIIISDHGRQIAQAIMAEVDRGATLIKVTGAYTGTEKLMVYCACSKSQIFKVRTIARQVDPDALFMVTETSEVVGEGFVPPPIPGN